MAGAKGNKIWMKKSDFIKEHKKLIALLEKYPKKDLRAEAAEQKAEVKKLVGSAGPSDVKPEESYPEDVMRVLDAMAFGDDLQLVGSMSLRSQQYAGDFDAYEIVEMDEPTDQQAAIELRKDFQEIVRNVRKLPNTYITDIKAGVIPEWRVIPEDGYDYENAVKKVDEMLENKIITPSEATEAKALLHRRPTVTQMLEAKNILKFHIVRWTPMEIAKNKKVLRDGRIYTLEQAFQTPSITKLDVISLVQNNRFTDFSAIYEFKNKGKALNQAIGNVGKGLQEDIKAYKATGNYSKALKRMFALAKFNDNRKEMERLTNILNSDLGRLYQIVSDIGTLEDALENKADLATIKYEIDQFKSRLANVYTLPSYLKKESGILSEINDILRLPRNKMAAPLKALGDKLDDVLQAEAKKLL